MLFIGGPWDGQEQFVESVPFFDIAIEDLAQPATRGSFARPTWYGKRLYTYQRDELRTRDFVYPFYRSYSTPIKPEECFRAVVEYLHDHPDLMSPKAKLSR